MLMGIEDEKEDGDVEIRMIMSITIVRSTPAIQIRIWRQIGMRRRMMTSYVLKYKVM